MRNAALRGFLCSAGRTALCAAWLAAGMGIAAEAPAAAPPVLTLEQAGSRQPPDFAPAYEGQTVVVNGRVSSYPVHLLDYTHLAIQQGRYGLVLEASGEELDGFAPGDSLRAEGRITKRGGLPVLVPSRLEALSHGAPPVPVVASPLELQGLRYLGQFVTTEGRVVGSGTNSGGAYLLVGPANKPLKVFLPYGRNDVQRQFEDLERGDTVRVTGIASQYCPLPPFNSRFQVLVRSGADIVRTDKASLVEPWQAVSGLIAVFALAVLWWAKERRARAHRAMLQKIYGLGEEVLGATSNPEVLRRIAAVLPPAFGVTGVRLYIYNRAAKALDRVAATEKERAESLALDSPAGPLESAVITCFRNRALLAIPHMRRNPFPAREGDEQAATPRSILLVPLLAQGEIEGVLELDDDRRERELNPNDQAVVQHLGNQIGLTIKLFEQRSIREQLSRSEKLAALGQLISGVVNELRAPLAAIASEAETLLGDGRCGPMARELRVIASEAGRASEMVSRLVSFAHADRAEAKPVEIRQLLANLMEFREREWKARGIQIRQLIGNSPIMVTGSRGQLEQVLLNLIVHAEQAVAEAPEKTISIGARALAGRVLVEISYPAAQDGFDTDPFTNSAAAGLGVCRGIITGHGGDIRLERTPSGVATFQVDLPGRASERRATPVSGKDQRMRAIKEMTALSVEPEAVAQRELVELLTARGLRVVPVRGPAEAMDLVQRLRFDVVFCSLSIPGMDYVDVVRRVEDRAGALVLVAESRQAMPPGESALVLSKPIEEAQLDTILETVAASVAAALPHQ